MDLISPRVRSLVRAAQEDPDAFWAAAAELLPWFQKWDSVFEWDPKRPDERGRYFRWFAGARTNLAHNCVDRHVERGWGGHAALVYETERGERRVLTCARIGAVHLVVFAGFGAGALGGRLAAAGCRALFCADVTYRKGKDVPLKGIVDDALAGAPSVEKVVVLRRAPSAE